MNRKREGFNNDDNLSKLIKETEFKLKTADKEKSELTKMNQKDIETINISDLDDLTKVKPYIAKLRTFKFKVDDAD